MNPIPQSFGILRFDGAEELDFIGPWETLLSLSLYAGGPANTLLVDQTRAAVQCAKGMSVNPQMDLADCPPLDVLPVPCGQGTRREVGNPVLPQLRALRDVPVVEERHVRDDTAGKLQLAVEYYPSSVRYGSQAGDARAPAYVRNA